MATRIDLVEDVLPISELRLKAAQVIKDLKDKQRPLVITQYGRAVAVLLDVTQFQNLQDSITELEARVQKLQRDAEQTHGN